MPMIMREIIYRLLRGEQGGRLRHLAVTGGSISTIAQAVQRIHEILIKPFVLSSSHKNSG